ncbi:type II toxin-antitoxin system RelE family toxin [Brevifollis gellanilyticus]|uniref:Plasmid stabilization protein n=1 Tax=Brevifollis gellanilyticus TaxID=748831 RepID=A0A512MC88_9BACT|nr:type II toxin-antitoxin system RelE/ParE family toxin [Brevifollis gellanilyticus]GEP44359.1 hypothetical protein BGE01nite_36500 [Brevifollis gellanilyticus]
MKLELTEAFLKDVKSTRDAELEHRVRKMILKIEQASSLSSLPQVKAMSGHPGYYRLRLGNYRAGFEVENDTLVFLRCLHRRDIYRYFP